mmetsp:Transcript_10657/g.44057  ORF Transcript_10657/g.44057 Transcript_10657/m.44057 type:complete len:344 (+) Transcript_10657:5610-6641(+)
MYRPQLAKLAHPTTAAEDEAMTRVERAPLHQQQRHLVAAECILQTRLRHHLLSDVRRSRVAQLRLEFLEHLAAAAAATGAVASARRSLADRPPGWKNAQRSQVKQLERQRRAVFAAHLAPPAPAAPEAPARTSPSARGLGVVVAPPAVPQRAREEAALDEPANDGGATANARGHGRGAWRVKQHAPHQAVAAESGDVLNQLSHDPSVVLACDLCILFAFEQVAQQQVEVRAHDGASADAADDLDVPERVGVGEPREGAEVIERSAEATAAEAQPDTPPLARILRGLARAHVFSRGRHLVPPFQRPSSLGGCRQVAACVWCGRCGRCCCVAAFASVPPPCAEGA